VRCSSPRSIRYRVAAGHLPACLCLMSCFALYGFRMQWGRWSGR
jgi:hypothetical protein